MADLIDRDEAKKAMTAAVRERADRFDISPLEAQLTVRAYSKVLDDLPAASQVVGHEYTPSMNPNDQGECTVCGGGPHTRAPDPRDEAIRGLVEAGNQARLAFAGYVSEQSAVDKLDAALAAARKLKGGDNG